jgi:hypothetical protein
MSSCLARFGSPSAPHGRRVIMKTLLLVAAGATGAITLSSCATHETTATTANPIHRTYSRNELNKTGQPDTAGAIEAVNPDAQITR